MKCSLCGNEIPEFESQFPNYAWPIRSHSDPCCDKCYINIVGPFNAIIRPMPKSLQDKQIKYLRNTSIEDLKRYVDQNLKNNKSSLFPST